MAKSRQKLLAKMEVFDAARPTSQVWGIDGESIYFYWIALRLPNDLVGCSLYHVIVAVLLRGRKRKEVVLWPSHRQIFGVSWVAQSP